MSKQSKRHMGLEVQGDLVTSNSLMFRNRIINGDMRIDQRNSGAAVTAPAASSGMYVLDRFYTRVDISTGNRVSTQRSTVAPSGFTNSLLMTSLSSYSIGATEHASSIQAIEGYNIADLAWGTANAKPITLSFWVRSSLTGTFGGQLSNSGSSRCLVFSYTINAANTWEQKTITVPGDTSGTWLTENNIGLYVSFSIAAGASVSTSATGSWSSSFFRSVTGQTSVLSTNGATFYLTGVQLEAGSSASAFEHRPYAIEFPLCQRYYQRYEYPSNFGGGFYNTPTNPFVPIRFPTAMRAAPTLSFSSLADLDIEPFDVAPTSVAIDSSSSTGHSTSLALIDPAARTTGFACTLFIDTPGGWIAFFAEL